MLLTGLAKFKIYRIFPVISVHFFANNLVSRVLSLSGSNAMTRGSLKQLWTMFFKVKGNCNFTSFVIILKNDILLLVVFVCILAVNVYELWRILISPD